MKSAVVKKMYAVKTRPDVDLAFVPCPENCVLLAWDEAGDDYLLTFGCIDGSEKVWRLKKNPDEQFTFVGRLLSLGPQCTDLVDADQYSGKIVRFKDYVSGDFHLPSALLSLCSAARLSKFPIDKCHNPLVLLKRA